MKRSILFSLFLLPVWSCQSMQVIKDMVAHLRPISANPITWFHDNFYTVQEGQCYRSKTLSEQSLERCIKEYGIKTILNLREDHGAWYQKEKDIAQKYGVNLITHTLSARVLPSAAVMRTILELFETPHARPILIHCQAGADRTGLIAAFWKLTQEHALLSDALTQQIPFYGHFEWRYPRMREFIKTIAQLKEQTGNWHDALNLYENELAGNPLKPMDPAALRALIRAKNMLLSTAKNNSKKISLAIGITVAAIMMAYFLKMKSAGRA